MAYIERQTAKRKIISFIQKIHRNSQAAHLINRMVNLLHKKQI